MTKGVVGASFEIKQWHPARKEGEVVDELGERGEGPSREEKEYFWTVEGMIGVGNKPEGRVSLLAPRALGASLLHRLQALRLHSPRGPRLLPYRCLLPPRDQFLGQTRIRRTLQCQLELPGGCEQS